MNYEKHYKLFENSIEELKETVKADNEVNRLLKKLKGVDSELMFTLDSAIGALARAYEKQGFNGGLAAAREIRI